MGLIVLRAVITPKVTLQPSQSTVYIYSILTGFLTLASAFDDQVEGRKQAAFGAIFLKFKDGLYGSPRVDVVLVGRVALLIPMGKSTCGSI